MQETLFVYTYSWDSVHGNVINVALAYSPPPDNVFDWAVPFIRTYPSTQMKRGVLYAMTDGFEYGKLVPCHLFEHASDENIADVICTFTRALGSTLESSEKKWSSEALVVTKSHLYKIGRGMEVTEQTKPYCCIGRYADECEGALEQLLPEHYIFTFALTEALLQPRRKRGERAKYLPKTYCLG